MQNEARKNEGHSPRHIQVILKASSGPSYTLTGCSGCFLSQKTVKITFVLEILVISLGSLIVASTFIIFMTSAIRNQEILSMNMLFDWKQICDRETLTLAPLGYLFD